jgi:hypothetical protein
MRISEVVLRKLLSMAQQTTGFDTRISEHGSALACIIRERHATEGFGRQRIAEEEDGSVKLMRGTWLQALQAHTIEVATILGRGFALCSFGSGENGNSSGERS